jgi:hypothetical protein
MSGRLHTKAKLCRYAAYFASVITLISGMSGPLPLVYQQYRAEHQWPIASATVKSFRQPLQTVHPSRGSSYAVYWMEFLVIVDLPISDCPRPMPTVANGSGLCAGIYRTIGTKSSADAWQWGSRHPILSRVQVHYDPNGGLGNRVFFAANLPTASIPGRESSQSV